MVATNALGQKTINVIPSLRASLKSHSQKNVINVQSLWPKILPLSPKFDRFLAYSILKRFDLHDVLPAFL